MKVVNAKWAESWSFSVFGNPKITIICGNCGAQSGSRDYFINNTNQISIYCKVCSVKNKTRLYLA